MDDVRGIIQGAANPFLTGFQGLGVGAITDSAVNPVTYAAAQQTLQGIHDLGNVSPAAQLAARAYYKTVLLRLRTVSIPPSNGLMPIRTLQLLPKLPLP